MAYRRKIDRGIGPLLRIDNHMIVGKRGHYTYLCIQLNLNKPLSCFVTVKGYKQSIVCKGLNSLCFTCGRIDQFSNKCVIKLTPDPVSCSIPKNSSRINSHITSSTTLDNYS
ncbi:hypothetical protein PVK06_025287 [Gossypium arboreum]|uniref:Uncharacterized protein n=1 Tax=Gossypium arboreum TaxID=29729 RepID=A0ABR0PG61_GOSAR|nr:hypothetical protein PVK06_025287 [Gossypium arboreum]